MIRLRHPKREDGGKLWSLAKDSKVLDLNSSYSYIILADQFSSTCVLSELDEQPAGFATAYRLPQDPSTLFLWQIAVAERARGQGLALRQLKWLLAAESCRGVSRFQTTITPSNEPSTRLFRAFARELGAELTVVPYILREDFPDPGHEEENLFRIGPFDQTKIKAE